MAAWTDVPSASIILENGGLAPPSCFYICDDQNKLVFEDPCDEIDPPFLCTGILAIGGICADSSGSTSVNGVLFERITEGDITFADGWDGCPGRDDICMAEELATHELGHTIGLGHSSENSGETDPDLLDATMYFLIHDDGRCADVRANDVAGVSFIYPQLTGDKLLQGKKLLVRDKADDETKRKIIVLSNDASAITTPAASPVDAGATLIVQSMVDPNDTDTFLLDAGAFDGTVGWKALGNPPGLKGFKYLNKNPTNGPCSLVLLKPGRLLKAVCKGDRITYALDEEKQTSVAVKLSVGGTHYCMLFEDNPPGSLRLDWGTGVKPSSVGVFKTIDAAAPWSCPIP